MRNECVNKLAADLHNPRRNNMQSSEWNLAGKAILVISSDLPEAIGISDRLLVMRSGRIVQELNSRTASEEDVMSHATGTAAQTNGEFHD